MFAQRSTNTCVNQSELPSCRLLQYINTQHSFIGFYRNPIYGTVLSLRSCAWALQLAWLELLVVRRTSISGRKFVFLKDGAAVGKSAGTSFFVGPPDCPVRCDVRVVVRNMKAVVSGTASKNTCFMPLHLVELEVHVYHRPRAVKHGRRML